MRKSGATLAYWRSDENGRPANGGRGLIAKAGDVHETHGPLRCCAPGTLHATLLPQKWKGERLWLVAMIGETVTQEDKIGALKREIIADLGSMP